MDTELFKVITPIVTFILGSVLTLAAKTLEDRRQTLRTATRDAVRLTKEWYEQIRLLVDQPMAQWAGGTGTNVYDYVHNRLILPEFLLHLAVLRRYRRAARLQVALEEFLSAVTTYNRSSAWSRPVSEEYTGATLGGLVECKPVDSIAAQSRETLRLLDGHFQRISREAAALL